MSGTDVARLTTALREVLTDELGALGEDALDSGALEGLLVVHPGRDSASSPKEVPLGAVLHKIVLVRDRLRLVEQVVNAAGGLDDLQRLRLQARITRVQEALVALGTLLAR